MPPFPVCSSFLRSFVVTGANADSSVFETSDCGSDVHVF
jgi:hypothetical protein